MKPITKQIDVFSKFTLDTHSENLEPSLALEKIRSGEGGCCHKATRQEDGSVSLQKTDVTCPYCNFIHTIKKENHITQKQIDIMEKWADPQSNFSDEENELVFFSADMQSFTCPNCNKESNSEGEGTTILFTREKSKVSVRCEIKELEKVINLPYLPKGSFPITFPFYEQIEFNLRNAHTCVRIVTQDSKVLHSLDITNNPLLLTQCEFANWFNKFDTVRLLTAETFEAVYPCRIPFEFSEISLENLVFMTRFVGYDKAFYVSIPYDRETLVIDKSFKNLKKLHTRETALEYLSSFSFSAYKSIRKGIFEQSGLLFYLPECEALFQGIKDVNVFKSLLEHPFTFNILLTLHERPICCDFFTDYCAVKGASALLGKINGSGRWGHFKHYLLEYCSLSQYSKSFEQEKWKHKFNQNRFHRESSTKYSLPVVADFPENTNCKVDGFTFKSLENTCELFKAGTELNNCLVDWGNADSVVVSVSLANEIIAALEVCDGCVMQARTYRNGSISAVDALPEAIEKWASLNKLEFSADEFAFNEELRRRRFRRNLNVEGV